MRPKIFKSYESWISYCRLKEYDDDRLRSRIATTATTITTTTTTSTAWVGVMDQSALTVDSKDSKEFARQAFTNPLKDVKYRRLCDRPFEMSLPISIAVGFVDVLVVVRNSIDSRDISRSCAS